MRPISNVATTITSSVARRSIHRNTALRIGHIRHRYVITASTSNPGSKAPNQRDDQYRHYRCCCMD
jgi:hypothetical protein